MRVPPLASLIASLLLASAGSLYAACTSPSAPIGSQNWNGTAFQFCDGTTWQTFAGSQWSDGASSAIYYNSGNVGIGTSTPATKLDVSGNGRVTGVFTGYSTRLGNYGGGHANIYPANNADIFFSNNAGTPLMMIDADSTGNVGIGTISPAGQLHLYKNEPSIVLHDDGWSGGLGMWRMHVANSNGKLGLQWNTAVAGDFSSTAEPLSLLTNGNVGIGTTAPTQLLHVNGTAYATTFLHTSDRRLKTDISSIATATQLTTKLRGVHFKWKKDGVPAYGVIAQEVEAVMPDAVTTNADGTKAVDYDQLIPVLIEAVKSLQVEVDALKRERAH